PDEQEVEDGTHEHERQQEPQGRASARVRRQRGDDSEHDGLLAGAAAERAWRRPAKKTAARGRRDIQLAIVCPLGADGNDQNSELGSGMATPKCSNAFWVATRPRGVRFK